MVKAIAEGNSPGILLEAMRELENRQTEIAAELKAVQVPEIPQAEVESYLAEWRRMLRGSMMQGRQVIQKIVRGRILMIPLKDGAGYEFRADTRFDKLLFSGMAIPVPGFLENSEDSRGWEHLTAEDTGDAEKEELLTSRSEVVSPTGFEPVLPP